MAPAAQDIERPKFVHKICPEMGMIGERVGMLTVDAVWNFGGSSTNIEPVSQFSAPLDILLRNPGYFTLAEKSATS